MPLCLGGSLGLIERKGDESEIGETRTEQGVSAATAGESCWLRVTAPTVGNEEQHSPDGEHGADVLWVPDHVEGKARDLQTSIDDIEHTAPLLTQRQ